MGYAFRVVAPEVDEAPGAGESPPACALRIAVDKAHAVAALQTSARPMLVLAADTVVALDGHILGKPTSEDHAREMLERLGGQTHVVITGVCVRGQTGTGHWRDKAFAVQTRVTMKPLSSLEIDAYIRTGEPMDKAGAYAIQGKAAYMVRAIDGSYTNVVGLPLTEVAEAMTEALGISADV